MTLRYLTPLTPQEQLDQGLPHPFAMAMADRVRVSEIDPLNHVNNKAYLDWFEAQRVQYYYLYFNQHFPTRPYPNHVVRNAQIHYVKEMRLGEDYIVTARVLSFRRTSYRIEQQVWSGGELRTTYDAVMVLRSADGSGSYAIPESLRTQFVTLDGASAEA